MQAALSKINALFFTLTVILSSAAAPAHADTALDKIRDRGQLSVCYGGFESPGFAYLDKAGKPAGLTWDLIVDLHQRFSTALGKPLKLNLVRITAVNRIIFVKQGRCDFMVTSLLDTPERRREIDFASPGFYSAAAAVFAPKTTRIDSWADLQGKTVCAPASSVWVRPYEAKGLKIAAFPGFAEVHQAVADGRCVASIGDDTGYAKIKEEDRSWSNFEVKLIGDERLPWGIALKKNEPELKQMLGSIVEQWHRERFIIGLEHKYQLPPNLWAKNMAERYAVKVGTR